MGVSNFDDLFSHFGHHIAVVVYGDKENVAIECEDCNEVLFDFDNEGEGSNG